MPMLKTRAVRLSEYLISFQDMLPEQAPLQLMVNLDAAIRHFWVQAVEDVKWDYVHYDVKALDALNETNDPNRRDAIRKWLETYRVFRVRGIAPQKTK